MSKSKKPTTETVREEFPGGSATTRRTHWPKGTERRMRREQRRRIEDAFAAKPDAKVTEPVVVFNSRNQDRDVSLLELAKALRENAAAVGKLIDKLAEAPQVTVKDCIVFSSDARPAFEITGGNEP
jgi:uncharacterized membrane protein YqiK